MIVLAADMHKSSHTIAGVGAATGEMLGDKTVQVGARGFDQLLRWARGRGSDRVWGAAGLPACLALLRAVCDRSRRTGRPGADAADGQLAPGPARERGKSDRIDALAVARAAPAEAIKMSPTVELAGPELDIRLLVDRP